MRLLRVGMAMVLFGVSGVVTAVHAATAKQRLLVVSSYSRDYIWSQETNKGLCAAFKEMKFLENDQQIADFTKNDAVESSNAVIKKLWMDTKKKSKKEDILAATTAVEAEIAAFKPDLVLLGNDNAVNYVGAKLINTPTPVIFWGVAVNPMKYGYIENYEHPGHNMTGVYKSGYYKEGLESLKKIYPAIKTFAILSDESETGRAKVKALDKQAAQGQLPLQLVDEVVTNSFTDWKARALELQAKVDAFFIVNIGTLKDDAGKPVDMLEVGAWYLTNIKKPEAVAEGHLVQEGLLIGADDSGYKQGYEAGRMADLVLHQKKSPAGIEVITPSRGPIMANKLRAKALGLDLTGKDFIEELVDGSKALEKFPQP
ncbi:MAG: ABC transporter substrate binding protein [Candidatus Omnitrophota bacterium]